MIFIYEIFSGHIGGNNKMSQPTAEISYVSTMDRKDFWISGQSEILPQFEHDYHICGYRMNVIDNTGDGGMQVILHDGSTPFYPYVSSLDLPNDTSIVSDNTLASKFFTVFYIQTNLTYYDSPNNGWNMTVLNRDNYGNTTKFRIDFYTSNAELFDSMTVPDLQVVVRTKQYAGTQHYLEYQETAVEVVSSLGTGVLEYTNVHSQRMRSDGNPPAITGVSPDNTGSPLTISDYKNGLYSLTEVSGVNLKNGSTTREPHVLYRRIPLHVLNVSQHRQGDLQNPLVVYVLMTSIAIILLLIIYNSFGGHKGTSS